MHNYVLLFLLNNRNEVLLFRRINAAFGNNEYSLIGGKIDAGETARQALIREAEEEIGIHITQKDLTLVHTLHKKGETSIFFVCVFTTSQWQGQPTNREPAKHADLRWFPLDDLPKNTLSTHRHIIERVRKNINYSEDGW
jgi:8-oxo-dGTP diphosphatase